MIKNLLVVPLFFSITLYCQAVDGQFITNISPPVYSVTIAISLQDTMGTAGVVQIEFTYNSEALDFPSSPVKSIDYTLHDDFDLFTTQNITKSNDSTIRISLITLGNPPPVPMGTVSTIVVTYYFTITNTQETSNLIWTQKDIAPEFLQQNYQIGKWPNLNEPLSNVTGLDRDNKLINYFLFQNYPNPFNPSTTIRFSLPEETQLKINIYNMLGELVQTLAEGTYEAGYHKVTFNASAIPSGAYIYRIESNEYTQVRKLLFLK